MKIRPAMPDDLDAICELADQINQDHCNHHPDIFCHRHNDPEGRAFWLSQMEDPTGLMLAAEIGQQVLGFITAKTTQNTLIPFLWKNKICRIGSIVVADNAQGSGIGKALMDKALEWGKQQGCERSGWRYFTLISLRYIFMNAWDFRRNHKLCVNDSDALARKTAGTDLRRPESKINLTAPTRFPHSTLQICHLLQHSIA